MSLSKKDFEEYLKDPTKFQRNVTVVNGCRTFSELERKKIELIPPSPEWIKKMADLEDQFDLPDVMACNPDLYQKMVDNNIITTDGNFIVDNYEDGSK